VRAFHNICRHRGLKLVESKTNLRKIVCSYHCWGYSLAGELLTTPNIAGIGRNEASSVDKSALGLVPVRSGTWNGVVFVNVCGAAPPLDAFVGPLSERLMSFDLSVLGSDDKIRDPRRPRQLEDLCRSRDRGLPPAIHSRADAHLLRRRLLHRRVPRKCLCRLSQRRPIAEARARYDEAGGAFAALPMWPSSKASGVTETLALFLLPLGVILITPTIVNFSVLLPLAADHTRVRTKTWFIGDGARSAKYRAARKASRDFFAKVIREDIAVMECLQRMTPVREGLGLETQFSPYWERSLQAFQAFYAGRLGAPAER